MTNPTPVAAKYTLIPCADGSYDMYTGMQFSQFVTNVVSIEQAKTFIMNMSRPDLFLDYQGNIINVERRV